MGGRVATAPRTPGVRLRGPLRPAPLPPRRAVRSLQRLRRPCVVDSRSASPPLYFILVTRTYIAVVVVQIVVLAALWLLSRHFAA